MEYSLHGLRAVRDVDALYAGHGSGQRIDQLAFGGRLERADDGNDSIGH